MIKVKLEADKRNKPLFKIHIKENELEKYKFLKRALMESKSIKGRYNYQVPLRFFEPIINNIPCDEIVIDKKSILFYLEFSDDYDEKYYYKTQADAPYMKKWREEGCPNIYKVNLDLENNKISKEIAFQKLNRIMK